MSLRRLAPTALLFLGACAAAPEVQSDRQEASCVASSDPPIGSMIVRRERCIETTEESRQQARRQIEQMQEEQRRRDRPKAAGS
jgi:hypothetical protein